MFALLEFSVVFFVGHYLMKSTEKVLKPQAMFVLLELEVFPL